MGKYCSRVLRHSQHATLSDPVTPLDIFVPFCGAIGLIYFALAYLINLKVLTSELSKMNKVLAIIMSGMCAMSGWWFTAQWLQGTF